MITAKETYEQFCQNWKMIGSDLPWDSGATPWTKKIFQYFSDEGKKKNFKVYADSGMIYRFASRTLHLKNDRPSEGLLNNVALNMQGYIAGTQEYMVDLCWSNEDKDKYYGLELAMESEWSESEDEILYDFSKIIDIKSYLKIMIISVQEKKISGIIDKMSSMASEGKIKLPNEEYLIIIFTDDFECAENERIGIIGFRMDNNGRYDKMPTYRFADGVLKSQKI